MGGGGNDVITMSKGRSKLILSSCRQKTVHETRSLEQEPSKSDVVLVHQTLFLLRLEGVACEK